MFQRIASIGAWSWILLASHDYIIEHNQLDPDQKRFLKHDALNGKDQRKAGQPLALSIPLDVTCH